MPEPMDKGVLGLIGEEEVPNLVAFLMLIDVMNDFDVAQIPLDVIFHD